MGPRVNRLFLLWCLFMVRLLSFYCICYAGWFLLMVNVFYFIAYVMLVVCIQLHDIFIGCCVVQCYTHAVVQGRL